MRYICLLAVLLALPLTASAQQKRAAEGRSQDPRSEERRAHRPATASPLPWWERQPAPAWEHPQLPAWETKKLPGWEQGNVARAMLDQQRIQRQRAEQLRHNQLPLDGTRRRWRSYQPSVVYVLPPYRYFPESIPTTTQFVVPPPPPTATVPVAPQEPPPAPMGALRLDVEPKESLQIFVDGVFVGTPADLGDEFELAPGTRRIELRARGYRTLTFSAEIVDGRSITYRGSLERIETAAAVAPAASAARVAPVAPAGGRVMYMIPGCYLGNVSPKNVTLPPGCDLGKVTTISR